MTTLGENVVSTVFLDRDGTINVKPFPGKYITSSEDLVLLPGADLAVAQLNAAGLRTVLITNQRWLSQPSADFVAYQAIQSRLEQLLAARGAWLDASYFCPHAIATCDCRKPGTGMLQRAAREHRFSLRESLVIGDSETDLMAGRPVGAATILLRSEPSGVPAGLADAVATDLMAAVGLILQARAARTGPGSLVLGIGWDAWSTRPGELQVTVLVILSYRLGRPCRFTCLSSRQAVSHNGPSTLV